MLGGLSASASEKTFTPKIVISYPANKSITHYRKPTVKGSIVNYKNVIRIELGDVEVVAYEDGTFEWQYPKRLNLGRNKIVIQTFDKHGGTQTKTLILILKKPIKTSPEPFPYSKLTLAVSGQGKIRVHSGQGGNGESTLLGTCPRACRYKGEKSTYYVLEAIPSHGSYFVGWEGYCKNQSMSCNYIFPKPHTARNVKAIFAPIPDNRHIWLGLNIPGGQAKIAGSLTCPGGKCSHLFAVHCNQPPPPEPVPGETTPAAPARLEPPNCTYDNRLVLDRAVTLKAYPTNDYWHVSGWGRLCGTNNTTSKCHIGSVPLDWEDDAIIDVFFER